MKQIIVSIVLATGMLSARADFVIQQKVTSVEQNGIITMKYHGDRIRTDMPTERVGDVSIIRDLQTGNTITLLHQQKMARQESGAENRRRLERLNSELTNSTPPKLVDTGKAEKVGDYDAEIYFWTNSNGVTWTFWVAKDFPNYSKIRSMYEKLEKTPVGQLSKNTAPNVSSLPGMAVKTKIESPAGEITRTLVSVKEEPVAASEFQVPADYLLINPETTPGHSKPSTNQ